MDPEQLQNEFDEDDALLLALDDLLSSSEDEEETKWGGSRAGKAPNKHRQFALAYQQVVEDYFSGTESVYDERDFERRFRVPRATFNRVHDALMGQEPFVQKRDATGKLGIHPLVKLVACFRYIAHGDAHDRDDENLRIAQGTLRPFVKQSARLMVKEFGGTYLNRFPTKEERTNISRVMATKGFPGCIGSWDCKHFNWKNCPMRWAGQLQGHAEGGKKTLTLEAIADHRKYFWAVNFGDAGSLNDLNALDRSSIVGSMMDGTHSIKTDPYEISGNVRDWMHFLVDGVYPEWAIFVNTYSKPSERKRKKFATKQERVRKDIECAFGIVVQRFHVLQRPLRQWHLDDLQNLIQACTILHNMVVVERFGDAGREVREELPTATRFALFGKRQVTRAMAHSEGVDVFAARVAAFDSQMRSPTEHYKLKQDLVDHTDAMFADEE